MVKRRNKDLQTKHHEDYEKYIQQLIKVWQMSGERQQTIPKISL